MALPPEQINIKRRREEEPVETLYIQSDLHHAKRRFTDYVFHRVTLNSSGAPVESGASTPPHPAAQRLLRSPRSVSSLQIPPHRTAAARTNSSNGIPTVRATSPGAEIREAQRAAAARKEAEEKRKRAIHGPPTPQSVSPVPLGSVLASERGSIGQEPVSVSVPPSPRHAHSVRRFQISRPSASTPGSRPGSRAGIQKRRADGALPGIAVLVEQLQRKPHSRQASMIADLVHQASESQESIKIKTPAEEIAPQAKPRKRPVVNQAEKKWREERQAAISAAKDHLSETLEKSARAKQSTWDEESERLAKEFEQVALDIERDMDVEPRNFNDNFAPPSPQPRVPFKPPQPLKHQPRPPKQSRIVPSQASLAGDEMKTDVVPIVSDDDDDYVYDVYIRRPLEESDRLANPLTEIESEQQLKALNSGVGVIVITEEDEQYWENFIEDDEEEWDSEDADSNGRLISLRCFQNTSLIMSFSRTAENNPANEYPEEELSSSDEEDDPTAIYRKYRNRAASDDEEFGFDYSGSEGGRFGQWRSGGQMYSDDESD
ncbi:uncharacterized protein N7484_004768 [Penicillium longicatenatum]|uniref:uncharacterized protein n=1 Tax=Penicillium longicatenatum TaxID=1561947 RepID=UPI00254706AC|nr:uncharacterized protein N7484_004768 [Penicillium longicatenatum]KAJ5651045.1 hypothetical protein N7484_004768 [Penicillium longicatenatum]